MTQSRLRAVVFGFLLFTKLVSPLVYACTYFPPNYKVGKNFTVMVSSLDGTTFAGVRVILVRADRLSKVALTDQEGRSRFENVEPGDYLLEIDQLGTAGWDTAGLTVAEGLDSRDIELHWPSSPILRATELKGTFLDSRTARPVREIYLQLVRGLSGSLEARLLTDKTGKFDLGSPEPGLYFIKVDPLRTEDREPRGVIPVLVLANSNHELTVALGESSCGLLYSEVCAVSPRTMSHLEGKLTDDQGAVIDRAQIDLESKSQDEKDTRTAVPDKTGHFAVTDVAPGDYQLRISSTGFAPFLIPISVAPKAPLGSPLDVRLSILGSTCADAKVNKPKYRAN